METFKAHVAFGVVWVWMLSQNPELRMSAALDRLKVRLNFSLQMGVFFQETHNMDQNGGFLFAFPSRPPQGVPPPQKKNTEMVAKREFTTKCRSQKQTIDQQRYKLANKPATPQESV